MFNSINLKLFFTWIGLIFISIFVFIPLIWGLRTSFIPNNEFSFIPTKYILDHYIELFKRPIFLLTILNTLYVTFLSIIISIPIALLGAFSIARFNFPGKKFSILLIILPLIPAITILVPLLSYINKMGLIDTYISVVLVNTVFHLPFAVWMLRNFILATPVEIEESALIDGCNYLNVLIRITTPSIYPGLIAVSVFLFISTWNNYLYAFALIATPEKRVISQAMLAFLSAWGNNYGGLCAAGMICIIPPILIFLLFQKWFIAGIVGAQLK